jgi:tetratricopeptide (TPR) repeat protein
MNYLRAGGEAEFRLSRLRTLLVNALPWFLTLGLVPAVTLAQSNAPRFTVTNYAITAELFPSQHLLSASARIDFLPQADLTTMSFELQNALRVSGVKDATGRDCNFRQEGIVLSIDFLNPVPQDKPASITVKYGGLLSSAEGSPVENLKLAYVGNEGSYLLYVGRWFPVSEYGVNRFAASVSITVPSDEMVIASGKASNPVREAGKVTYAFQYDRSSFPGTVIAGRYVVQPATAVGADITLYMKPGHESFAANYGEAAAKIMAFYSDKFGSLPNGHLDIAEIEDGTVNGYSAPGLVALASRLFSTQVKIQQLAQQISYQWWGESVSPASRNDFFLEDGLATYSAALYVQDSEDESAFENLMQETEVGALTHEDVASIGQSAQLHEYTPEYQSIVFQKGAMVLHMLRWVIGDEAFFKTLADMCKQYAGKSISTDQFQKLAEAASKQELTYFFAQWVTSTGVPQFTRVWSVYRTAKGYQVVGKITQDLDLFRMPVEVRVITEGSRPVTDRVPMVGTTANFTVNVRTRPTRVLVDPASRILKFDDKIKFKVEMARADQLAAEQAYLEAVKQYNAVLELSKNNSLAHYRLGDIYFKLRNYNAAMEEFRRALDGDLDPKWTEVWSHVTLGMIFDTTGQRDRALNEYQRALQTNDNTQGALDKANEYVKKPYTAENKQPS